MHCVPSDESRMRLYILHANNEFVLNPAFMRVNRTTLPLVAESELVLCARYALLFAEGRLPSCCFCSFPWLLYAVTPKLPPKASGRRLPTGPPELFTQLCFRMAASFLFLTTLNRCIRIYGIR